MAENLSYQFRLLRHAESEGNAKKIWQGQTDYSLTGRGKKQAEILANKWKQDNILFDLIISSPLKRAKETAEILSGELLSPLQFDSIWMERDNGQLAGKSFEANQRNHPQKSLIHPYSPIGKTGETNWELYLRGCQALNNLMKLKPGNYLIVSHGGLLNMVLYAVLGVTPLANQAGPRFRFENTAFATLFYYPHRHRWLISSLNDCEHLDELQS